MDGGPVKFEGDGNSKANRYAGEAWLHGHQALACNNGGHGYNNVWLQGGTFISFWKSSGANRFVKNGTAWQTPEGSNVVAYSYGHVLKPAAGSSIEFQGEMPTQRYVKNSLLHNDQELVYRYYNGVTHPKAWFKGGTQVSFWTAPSKDYCYVASGTASQLPSGDRTIEYAAGLFLAPQDGTQLEFSGTDWNVRYLTCATLFSSSPPVAANLRYRYATTFETVALRSGSPVRFSTDEDNPNGFVEEGILHINQHLKYKHKVGGTTYTSTAEFKGLSPVSISATTDLADRCVIVGVLDQAIAAPPIAVPANSQIVVAGNGQLTYTVLSTPPLDTDLDGFTDYEEEIANTDPHNAASKPPFLPGTPIVGQFPQNVKAFVCYGDGLQGVAKPATPASHALLAGSPAYVVVLAINTKEFIHYTRSHSDYNDTVTWSVNVNGQTLSPVTTTKVNDLHGDFFRSWPSKSSFFDYTSVHIRVLGVIPSNPAAPTTVAASLVIKNIGDSVLPTAAVIALVPIDIEEVISDQIAGNECNKLPTRFFKDSPNNPMLMATRTGVDARLAVKMNLPASVASKIFVGARKVGTTAILGSTPSIALPGKTSVSFNAIAGHEIYEVVAGFDANTNSTLDNPEVAAVFQKTPKTDSKGATITTGLGNLDKIIIGTESAFTSGKNWLKFWGNLPTADYAGDCLDAFADDEKTIPGTTITDPVPISSATKGLSHPVGAKWNSACQDNT